MKEGALVICGGLIGGAAGAAMERTLRDKHQMQVSVGTTETPLEYEIALINSGDYSEDNIIGDIFMLGDEGMTATVDRRFANPSVLIDHMSVTENFNRDPVVGRVVFTMILPQLNPGDHVACYIICDSNISTIQVAVQSNDVTTGDYWVRAEAK